jgi:hypothetical protein
MVFEGMGLAGAGLLIGAACALGLTRFMDLRSEDVGSGGFHLCGRVADRRIRVRHVYSGPARAEGRSGDFVAV